MNKKIKVTVFLGFIVMCFFFLTFKTLSAAEVSRSVDVSKDTKTIILKDSDGDGLLDSEDPHPDVAEIYIVSDENKNGIVDSFESVVEVNNINEKSIEDVENDEE